MTLIALFKAVENIQSEYHGAKILLDHLDQANLAKAFRGELVAQDPNDEPASVLLERIRAERARPAAPQTRTPWQGRNRASGGDLAQHPYWLHRSAV